MFFRMNWRSFGCIFESLRLRCLRGRDVRDVKVEDDTLFLPMLIKARVGCCWMIY